MKRSLLVVIYCLVFGAISCYAQSVSISPNPQIAQLQQNFTVNARLDTATQTRGCAIWFIYDPAKITFVAAARGSLFNGYNVGWWQLVHESTSMFRVECIIFGNGVYTTGPGNLLNLTFNAANGDFTTIQIFNIELYNITGYVMPNVDTNDGDVIIGASPAYTKAKCWLQGPYSSGEMSTGINSILPLTSPFSQDPVTVASIPADVVDWMLIELRSTATGQPVKYQSLFLGSDGYLRTPGKPYLIFMDTIAGSYYTVIRHRNHLPVMSGTSFQFVATGSPPELDLTSISNIYGGLGVIQVSPGVYALPAGDADTNGSVAPSDRNLYWRIQAGLSGYLASDFNLNGNVAPTDLNALWRVNSGISTGVPASR